MRHYLWSRLGNVTEGNPSSFYDQILSYESPGPEYRQVPYPEEIDKYDVFPDVSVADPNYDEDKVFLPFLGKRVEVIAYNWPGSIDANLKIRLPTGNVYNILFAHLTWRKKSRITLIRKEYIGRDK